MIFAIYDKIFNHFIRIEYLYVFIAAPAVVFNTKQLFSSRYQTKKKKKKTNNKQQIFGSCKSNCSYIKWMERELYL